MKAISKSQPKAESERHVSDSEEEQLRLYREQLVSAATRKASSRSQDPDSIWSEAAGPGSYRWVWNRLIRGAPGFLGWGTVVISAVVLVGWMLGVSWMTGDFLNGLAFPVPSALMLGTLGVAVLLIRDGSSRRSLRAGNWLCLLVLVANALLLVESLAGLDLVDWGDGALNNPTSAALVNIPILALCLLTVDLDPPRYRWGDVLIPLVGVGLLIALLTNGYQAVIVTEDHLDFSYPGAAAAVMIYVAFVFLRPDRGLAGFLGEIGPGPSMARLLVPTALLIPIAMIVVELLASGLTASQEAFVRGVDKIFMLIVLLWVITYSSRRLQRYYEGLKQASAELVSQADVLTRMAEGVVVIRATDGEIVLTNPQFDAMHGYERGELLGQPIDRIAPTGLNEEELETRNRVMSDLADRGETTYETRAVRKDGTDIWSRVNGVVTTVPDHGPVVILVKYDMTEAHLAEHAGRDAEMRFRQVFEQSPIGLCLVSPDGGFDQVNRSFELITGYTSEELSGMTFADITHPEDLEKDLALTSELFAGKRDGFSLEKRYIRRNGDVVWIYLTVAMLRDQDGKPFQALSMVEDITERQRLSQQLKFLADHDPLTGLFNRRRLEDELELAITAGHGRGIAILVIDLDNFKFVNDSFGHTTGDRLIVRTAELLKSRLRANDTLARQGGDEFVVVLRDIPAEDALVKAEELVRLVGREVRVDGAEHSARVTASIGVAVASQGTPVPQETLMMQADIAMYEAKDAGRNGVRLFRPGEDSHVTLGIDWAGRLRTALDNDELLIYTQPICRLDETGPPHFELFVRMRDRNGQVILPGAFLPTAERHDLVQDMDAWVITKAIATLKELDSQSGPRLQINLSGRTVGDPKLPDFVQGELEKAGVEPSRLIFEVTETSAIGNMTRAQEFSTRMNELGCGFALDDFGTGFGSFYYLKHLAFDYVKIDGEFVQDLASDTVNQLLVRSLVEISRGMGKLTVAEQVEDAETLAMLGDFGVDFVQGYYLGRPRPLERSDLTTRTSIPVGTVGS